MQKLGVTTGGELKKKIPQLREELRTDEGFKNVYKFTFNFSKENAESKYLEFESAKGTMNPIYLLSFLLSFLKALWGVLLPLKFTLHKEWMKFLDVKITFILEM